MQEYLCFPIILFKSVWFFKKIVRHGFSRTCLKSTWPQPGLYIIVLKKDQKYWTIAINSSETKKIIHFWWVVSDYQDCSPPSTIPTPFWTLFLNIFFWLIKNVSSHYNELFIKVNAFETWILTRCGNMSLETKLLPGVFRGGGFSRWPILANRCSKTFFKFPSGLWFTQGVSY